MISGLTATSTVTNVFAEHPPSSRACLELRFYHLRNDFERDRLDGFLESTYLPATRRLGFGPVGFFNVIVGPDMPCLVTLTSYPSLAAMETAIDSLSQDETWKRAVEEVETVEWSKTAASGDFENISAAECPAIVSCAVEIPIATLH